MKLINEAKFPLSFHAFRTHFNGGDVFSQDFHSGYTPDVMRKAYSYNGKFSGEGVKIAIVSAFDNEAIEQNVTVFSQRFSLPVPKISVYYPDGKGQSTSREWLVESSLDTQWAHVFAPKAELMVVFSKNASVENLLSAAEYAKSTLSADVICMCFGTDESASDRELSLIFEDGGIFVSSSGDVGGRVSFPSSSPYCVSVGGTDLSLSPSGRRQQETAWKDGGGGASRVFEIPAFQGRFFNIFGMADGMRGTPDVSMSASFSPGVPVFVSQLGGWTNVGGTSLACACFSGVCAGIKERHPEIETSTDVLSFLYSKAGGDGYVFPQYDFHDITVGKSGDNFAGKGWDFATGLGSPVISQILI